jgi:hypothetical protein
VAVKKVDQYGWALVPSKPKFNRPQQIVNVGLHQPRRSSAGPVASCEVITTPVRAPFSCVLRRPFLSSSALLYVPPALRRFRACWSNHGTHATAHHQRRTALLDPYHVIHDDAHQKESIDGNVDCNSYRPLRQWLLVYTRTLLAGYYDVPSFISKAKGILEEKT